MKTSILVSKFVGLSDWVGSRRMEKLRHLTSLKRNGWRGAETNEVILLLARSVIFTHCYDRKAESSGYS